MALRSPLLRFDAGDREGARRALLALTVGASPSSAAQAARGLRVLGLAQPGDPTAASLDPVDVAALFDTAPDAGVKPLPPGALQEWLPRPLDWSGATARLTAQFGATPALAPGAEAADPRLASGMALFAVDEPAVGRELLGDLLASVVDPLPSPTSRG